MENKNHIIEELLEVSPAIVKIGKSNIYSVSPQYFENLSGEIMEKIHAGTAPIYSFSTNPTYKTPEGYFDSLAGSILARAVQAQGKSNEVFEELEEVAPLLNSINKGNLYSVPANYFDEIRIAVPETRKQEAKIIQLKRETRNFSKYLAAAVIIMLVAVGLYLFEGKQQGGEQANNVNAEVNHVSEDEIINYLKATFPNENVSTITSNKAVRDINLKKSLQEMSDDEIRQFLHENGESDEI